MAKKKTQRFTATLVLNPEKAGAWMASVFVETPINVDANAGKIQNSMYDVEQAVSKQTAWKNASAAKRWIKEQVGELTPRKSVKMIAGEALDVKGKPTSFSGVLEYKV
jgi:hypothetical protein